MDLNSTRPQHTSPSRRRLVGALGLALGLSLAGASPQAAAQGDFPVKPITLVVPFASGGTTDLLARLVGQQLAAELGQPVVVENHAGAGGNVGSAQAARAAADGYTLLMGTVGTHAINMSLYKKMPFDPVKDFVPLSRVATVPNLLVTNPARPYKTVAELIAHAKANPGRVTFGSAGNGSSPHVSGELFKAMTKTDLVHVPYRGSAPVITDLLANQIDLDFENLTTVMPYIKTDKLRAIAITSAKRSPMLPDVPTVAEAGVPGFEALSWFGLYAPAGTPAPVVAQLGKALKKALDKADYKSKVTELGGTPANESSAQFAEFMKGEITKWARVVKESGASVD